MSASSSRSVPRVGIGMTLHNRAAYLREALDSLLAQSYRDFRLALVDDGSEDETERIAREYAAKDARVTYVRNAPRAGMIAAWRQAFEQACGAGRFGPPDYLAGGREHQRWQPHGR